MEMTNFVGIDISKATLDFTCIGSNGIELLYRQIKNEKKEISGLINELRKNYGLTAENSVFCMEYTGIYNLNLTTYLVNIHAKIWMESGMQIKRSLGAVRGKNDKVDSKRIAEYAFTKRHKMNLWNAPREIITQLKDLLVYRALLIKQKRALQTSCGEKSTLKPKGAMKGIKKSTEIMVKENEKQTAIIEKQIMALIKGDEKLANLYKKITSVVGVGFVTAIHMIVATNEFLNISDPKKFGCYCGVVPYTHQSGSSVRGRNRVSHMANKEIKTLLHLCATTVIKTKGELRDYYERKIAEGKHKMLVINAIRNKLVLRVFACVNRDKMFEKNYHHSLA